jgi:hypothetical protein
MVFTGVRIEDARRHFGDFPELHLFHMATNDATQPEFRKFAVALMLEKGMKSAYKPELADIRRELNAPPEPPKPDTINAVPQIGALSASVTTKTLNEEPVIHNVPVEPVQKMDDAPETPAKEAQTQEAAIPGNSEQNLASSGVSNG